MCRAAGVLVGVPAYVREAGRYWKIFVPRLRCARCGVSHALLPAFTLAWRLDVAETIGSVVGEVVAGGGCGVRPAAERAGEPYTTARGWVRRFRARAAELGVRSRRWRGLQVIDSVAAYPHFMDGDFITPISLRICSA